MSLNSQLCHNSNCVHGWVEQNNVGTCMRCMTVMPQFCTHYTHWRHSCRLSDTRNLLPAQSSRSAVSPLFIMSQLMCFDFFYCQETASLRLCSRYDYNGTGETYFWGIKISRSQWPSILRIILKRTFASEHWLERLSLLRKSHEMTQNNSWVLGSAPNLLMLNILLYIPCGAA